jgi:hypothetical protein
MERELPAVRSFDALRIAKEDAVRVYRDLSGDRIEIFLADDGWHVNYRVEPAPGQGGRTALRDRPGRWHDQVEEVLPVSYPADPREDIYQDPEPGPR